MQAYENLERIVLEAQSGEADAAVIWLHGLGADGHDFEAIVPELHLPAEFRIRFIFPHAPVQPVTLNGGYEMRSWYDILGLDRDAQQDEPGIRAAAAAIAKLVEEQLAAGIASERIILAGFSQGGAVVLQLGLRYGITLGGILALSTYLPLKQSLAAEWHPANKNTPVKMLHGSDDPVIALEFAEASQHFMQALGVNIHWQVYAGMPHSVCAQEIVDIRHWLVQRLS